MPLLLMSQGSLYKTVKFDKPTYIGDPVNTVRLFSEKSVDELVLLDITAGKEKRSPDVERLRAIAAEAFMPMAYGGGIGNLQDAAAVFACGVEKVVLGRAALNDMGLLTAIADRFGAQSVVACIDFASGRLGGPRVVVAGKRVDAYTTPAEAANAVVAAGAGEILLQSVDRDGTMSGYDLATTAEVARTVEVPVIAAGGAGSLDDITAVVHAGASAAAAGSLFSFHGRHRAVLITYPDDEVLEAALP